MNKHKNMFVYNNYNEFALDSYNYIKGNDIIAFISSIYEVIYWIRLEIIWKKLNVKFVSNGNHTTTGEPMGSVTLTYHEGEDIITTLPTIPDADRITSMNNFLEQYPYIENINLDTIHLKSLNRAFANSNLHSIIINTHNVTDYRNAFTNCNIDNLIIDFYKVKDIDYINEMFLNSTITNLEIENGNENLYILQDCNINDIKYINGAIYLGQSYVKTNNAIAKIIYIRGISDTCNITCDDLYITTNIASNNINNVLTCKTKNVIFNTTLKTLLNIVFDLNVLEHITISQDFIQGVVKSNINLNDINENNFILNIDKPVINNVFKVDAVNIDLINKFNFLPLFCFSSTDENKGADINIDLSNTDYIIKAPYIYMTPNNTYIKGKIDIIISPNVKVESYNIINTYTINDNKVAILNVNYSTGDINSHIPTNYRFNGIFKLNIITYIEYSQAIYFENIDNNINTYIGNVVYKNLDEQYLTYCSNNKIKFFGNNFYHIIISNDNAHDRPVINLEDLIIKNDKKITLSAYGLFSTIINIDNVENLAINSDLNDSILISSKNNISVDVDKYNNFSLFYNYSFSSVSIPEGYYMITKFNGNVELYLNGGKYNLYTTLTINGTIYLKNSNSGGALNLINVSCKSLVIQDNCMFYKLPNISEESINNIFNVIQNNTNNLMTIIIYRSQYNKLHEDTITNVLNKNYQFSIREN